MRQILLTITLPACLLLCSFFSYHFYSAQISQKQVASKTQKHEPNSHPLISQNHILAQINDTNAEIISEKYKKFKHTIQKIALKTSTVTSHVYEFLSPATDQKTT